jgi:hypothetical protein
MSTGAAPDPCCSHRSSCTACGRATAWWSCRCASTRRRAASPAPGTVHYRNPAVGGPGSSSWRYRNGVRRPNHPGLDGALVRRADFGAEAHRRRHAGGGRGAGDPARPCRARGLEPTSVAGRRGPRRPRAQRGRDRGVWWRRAGCAPIRSRPEVPIIQGEPPSGPRIPSGCDFRTRCPQTREPCAATVPPLARGGSGRGMRSPASAGRTRGIPDGRPSPRDGMLAEGSLATPGAGTTPRHDPARS